MVRWLAKSGANFNQAADGGVTPVLIAAQEGHLEVVKFLVKLGADMNQFDNMPVSCRCVLQPRMDIWNW